MSATEHLASSLAAKPATASNARQCTEAHHGLLQQFAGCCDSRAKSRVRHLGPSWFRVKIGRQNFFNFFFMNLLFVYTNNPILLL